MTIDVLRYIGAVTREVQNREHEGKPARVVVATCAYDTDIEDLWDAITNRDRIPRWFMPVSGDLQLGGRYQLHGNASGQIVRCVPPRELHLTWEMGPDVSWVQVRLDELTDGGARLRLEHIAHVPEERWDQFGPGAVGVGWDLALMGLGLHIQTGEPNDPAAAMEWMVSEQGRVFITSSSGRWSDASIAAGTGEAAAKAAAGRTTAFYTGDSGACV